MNATENRIHLFWDDFFEAVQLEAAFMVLGPQFYNDRKRFLTPPPVRRRRSQPIVDMRVERKRRERWQRKIVYAAGIVLAWRVLRKCLE